MYVVPDQSGRTVVVTGANSGTGREAAERLAAAGAHVVLAVRSAEKGEKALAEILAAHPDASAEVRLLDLASLASVRAFAESLSRDLPHLDTLVNNAGVMAPPTRFETEDGFELQLGTNFLGPLALTNLLIPLLLAAPEGRVTTMSSGMANVGRIRFDDLQWTRRRYSPTRSYAQSKLADLLLARQLARVSMQRGWALRSNAAHPGFTQTNLQTAGASLGRDSVHRSPIGNLPFVPSQQPAEGAEPMLFAAADPRAVEDGYYGPSGRFGLVGPTGPARLNRRMRDDDTAARLWAVAQDLTGTQLPA
ncbi:SDR family oxidoreductase [uncultured Cellulomonas sp.]|uniref:SDR family oxidoreductase n=1 Tax=uncultured Cellulomonas sp. TaxID=189682 RepID=UPI0028F16996|nr:SDR family oxidoreductase [uncultured Cellulomonas sp.]